MAADKASVKALGQGDYLVKTNLDPEMLNTVALEVYRMWLDFALGGSALPGPGRMVDQNASRYRTDTGKRMLQDPSGRYAASIRFQRTGESTIAIYADEDIAPEAAYIERGHNRFDLKARFEAGRLYPLHRGVVGRANGNEAGDTPKVWAENRSFSDSGGARVPATGQSGEKADSWVLPAMAPYSPAMILSKLVTEQMNGGQI